MKVVIPIRWVVIDPARVKRVACVISNISDGTAYDGESFVVPSSGRFLEVPPAAAAGLFVGDFIADPAVFGPAIYCMTYFNPDANYAPLGFMYWEVLDTNVPSGWHHCRSEDGSISTWFYITKHPNQMPGAADPTAMGAAPAVPAGDGEDDNG